MRAVGNLATRMAAGCSVAPRPKAASEGPAGVLPCLELPTYAAACALVNSRYSCLVAGPHRRHIALSPRYLNKKRTGIREQLNAELLRYSERYWSLIYFVTRADIMLTLIILTLPAAPLGHGMGQQGDV